MGGDLHPNCSNGNGNEKNKGGKGGLFDVSQKVVVAVKASKEISRVALVWSLTHVAQPGDCITLLLVVPAKNPGQWLGFSFCWLFFCSRVILKIFPPSQQEGKNYGVFQDFQVIVQAVTVRSFKME